jgi:hypothetical protein
MADYNTRMESYHLVETFDNKFGSQVEEHSNIVDEISNTLQLLNQLITDFEHLRSEDRSQCVNIAKFEEMLDDLQENFRQEFPTMTQFDRLVPAELDLTQTDQRDLDRIIGKVEAIKMRYQDQIPIHMEKLNTHSTLYRIIMDIFTEIAKITRQEIDNSVRKQVHG